MEIENLYQENVHHGHNIRRIRKSKGMKQEDLASQVGMTQQNLSKIELRDTLNEEILARFAKSTGCSRRTTENDGGNRFSYLY